ncbi:MAG: 16S rRNA (guanine(527)-N(7))-methyltransferase RsmG [Pontixanthobacter sp.]
MIQNEKDAREYVASLCDGVAMDRLDRLAANLATENQRQNLIAQSSLANIWQRHIADSAQLLRFVPRGTFPWLDLGSGAGFPGVVVAIIQSDGPIFLVETRARRVQWLQSQKESLRLSHCIVIGKRVENTDTFKASVVTARAFAPLPKLLKMSKRFTRQDTVYVLPKGRSANAELAALPDHQREMFHVEQSLTDGDAGIIVGTGLP